MSPPLSPPEVVMSLASRARARQARRRLTRGGLDPAEAAALLETALTDLRPDETPPVVLGRIAEARSMARSATTHPDALDLDGPVDAALARLVRRKIDRMLREPDGGNDEDLRALSEDLAALDQSRALLEDDVYQRLGLARLRAHLHPHALRGRPIIRPLPKETPLLVERARMMVRRADDPAHDAGDPPQDVTIEVTTHQLAIAVGRTVDVTALTDLVAIDLTGPGDGNRVLLEASTRPAPIRLETPCPNLLAETLRFARLRWVRAGRRPSVSGTMSLGGMGRGAGGPGARASNDPRAWDARSFRLGGAGFSEAGPQNLGAGWVGSGMPGPGPDRDRDPDGLYALLGVAPTATSAEIKRGFRATAAQTHPDLVDIDDVDGQAQAEARFKAVAHAYRVLSDPSLRAAYRAGQAFPFD